MLDRWIGRSQLNRQVALCQTGAASWQHIPVDVWAGSTQSAEAVRLETSMQDAARLQWAPAVKAVAVGLVHWRWLAIDGWAASTEPTGREMVEVSVQGTQGIRRLSAAIVEGAVLLSMARVLFAGGRLRRVDGLAVMAVGKV